MAFCTPACGVPFLNDKKADGNVADIAEGGDYKEAPADRNGAVAGSTTGDGSHDWSGKPADKATTGRWRAAPFIFGAAMFESSVNIGVAFNLYTYYSVTMHLPSSKAAILTNIYWGSSFITSVIGGFVSDAYLGRFWTSFLSCIIELVGIAVLIASTTVDRFKPNCPASGLNCPSFAGSLGFSVFNVGLYLVALGTGCLRPCLAALGADQFDLEDPDEKKQIRSYFNWFFFFMSIGAVMAMTFVIYVSENISWVWGFAMTGIIMLLATLTLVIGAGFYRHKRPTGSPFTRMAQVIVASLRKRKSAPSSDAAVLFEVHDHESGTAVATEPSLQRFNSNKGEVLGEPTLKRYYSLPHTKGMTLLDKAAVVTEPEMGTQSSTRINPWRLCTVTQVEELKIVLRCLPIAGSTMFVYIVIAQMQTWGVAQGYTMQRKIGSFEFPPPSLSAIAVGVVLLEIALYDRWFVPYMRKRTSHHHGITHLQRISIGLVQSVLAMAYAAVLETIRLKIARDHGLVGNPDAVVPISIFWLLPQWILLASTELFVYVGVFEFFWQEMPVETRTLAGGISLISVAGGFYQSGVLVAFCNLMSKSSRYGGWLENTNLNKNRLNYYYLLLLVCSAMNAAGFIYMTKWYNYVKFINQKGDGCQLGRTDSAAAELVTSSPIPNIFRRSESRVPLKSTPSLPSPPQRSTIDGDSSIPTKVDAATSPDFLPRSESRTPLRLTTSSSGREVKLVTTSSGREIAPGSAPKNVNSSTTPPKSPRTIFSPMFSPHSTSPTQDLSPRYNKLQGRRGS